MTSCIMDTVVVFIYTYKNQFLVYLTKLNSLVKKLNIQHETYSKCLEIFLNNGNLDDVPTQIELEFSVKQERICLFLIVFNFFYFYFLYVVDCR